MKTVERVLRFRTVCCTELFPTILLFVCLLVCLSVCLFADQSFCLSVCLSVCLFVS